MSYIEYLNDFADRNDNDITNNLLGKVTNILNTCLTLGYTEEDAIDRVVSDTTDIFPEDEDIELYAKAVVESFFTISKQRDIFKEIAANKYDVDPLFVDDKMIEDLKNIVGVYNVDIEPTEGWDDYYYNVALQTARNSKCLSRKIGAVLVKDKVIISAGYNGPPRGIAPCDERWFIDEDFIGRHGSSKEHRGKCPRLAMGAKSGQMLDECLAVHAEENAILTCARMGIEAKGSTMYMTCSIPCFRCMSKIINAGVSELVMTGTSIYDGNTMYLLKNSDVKVRLYNFI